MGRIRHLEGLLSICMSCKKIRGAANVWLRRERYISEHSDAVFSHGMCPECLDKEIKNKTDPLSGSKYLQRQMGRMLPIMKDRVDADFRGLVK